MKALILAGGKGTRLSEITKNEIPKPMAPINGKPIIEYVIDNLKQNGIKDIVITVGYLSQVIKDHLKDGEHFGVNISYIEEKEPLGSGGALYYLKGLVKEDFIVCPGDAIFDIDVNRMERFHKEKGGLITLFAHPNLHPYDSDLIIADKTGLVKDLHFKNLPRDFYYKNCVNAGIVMIGAQALDRLTEPKKMNLEHDFVYPFIKENKVYCYSSPEYVKDVGTPERFNKTQKDLQLNLPRKKNLKNKQKAIFLDRDGTINVYKGFINSHEQIELLPKVSEAISKINQSEYLAIIISNQPVIARGEATFEQVDDTFNKIETLLGQYGVYIDGIYYCPHHPHKGFDGEIPELKFDCDCRKPKIGMLKGAEKDFNLDLSKCVMIGDTELDILTGKNANIPTVRVTTGDNKQSTVAPDYTALNLLDAVEWVLNKKN